MSTGGRVFPSITGGALERSAQTFVDLREAERDRALQSRQIGIAERAAAVNRIVTLANFLEPGTTLGDAGKAVTGMFGDAFGVDTTGLEGLELKPETFQTALDQKRLEFLDSKEFTNLLLPSTRAALGLEPSENVAATRDLEASMRLDALTAITKNPTLVTEFTSRVLGRQPVTLQIPGVEQRFNFDSEIAASIFGQVLIAQMQGSNRLDLANAENIKPLQDKIAEAVAQAGFSIGPPAISRVLGVYNAAVDAENTPGVHTGAGDAVLAEFLNNPRIDEGEKAGLQFLVGSVGIGAQAFRDNLPTQLSNFLRIGEAVRAVLPAEQATSVMESITQQLDPSFAGVLDDPLFGGIELTLGGQRAPGSAPPPPTEPSLTPGMISDDDILEAARLGDSRAQLIEQVGAERIDRLIPLPLTPVEETDIIAIPEGGINPDSVPAPFRKDVQQLNTLIRTLNRTEGDLARANLEAVISRMRTRITEGAKAIGGIGG